MWAPTSLICIEKRASGFTIPEKVSGGKGKGQNDLPNQ